MNIEFNPNPHEVLKISKSEPSEKIAKALKNKNSGAEIAKSIEKSMEEGSAQVTPNVRSFGSRFANRSQETNLIFMRTFNSIIVDPFKKTS